MEERYVTDIDTAKGLMKMGFKMVESTDKSMHWWEIEAPKSNIFHKIIAIYDDENGVLTFEIYVTDIDEVPVEVEYFKGMYDLIMIESVLDGAKII
jgi:hypothetical protein